MRGEDQRSEGFFSYVRLETRIPADHPLRAIREIVDEALRQLSPTFSRLYSREGRPSIPPEGGEKLSVKVSAVAVVENAVNAAKVATEMKFDMMFPFQQADPMNV
jgi:hypothetical protein